MCHILHYSYYQLCLNFGKITVIRSHELRRNHSRYQLSNHSDLSCVNRSVVICSFVEKATLELQITLHVQCVTVLVTQRTVMVKQGNVSVVYTTQQVRT